MKRSEYDLYLPLVTSKGTKISAKTLKDIKGKLLSAFGGFTDFKHRNEGAWRVGSSTFRDAILILRVLADEEKEADKFFKALKKELEKLLHQKEILIVKRLVSIIN
jgi:hypothetical protein